ncbi:hypothetical protein AgCh_031269 [Apium graveolens]
MADVNRKVDEIVSRTSKLTMEQEEEDWANGVFGRIWKLEAKWQATILKVDKERTTMGLTFEKQEDAKWVTEKMPWNFGGGLMIVEKWPESGN